MTRFIANFLTDGKWGAVPLLQTLEKRPDEKSSVDRRKHLFEFLPGRPHFFSGEERRPELLPHQAVQGVGPALLNPILDSRAAVFDGGPCRFHLLGQHRLELLLPSRDLLEDGGALVALLLAVAKRVLHQHRPQHRQQCVRGAAGVVDVAEDVLAVDGREQVLLAEPRGVELAGAARGEHPLGRLADSVLHGVLQVLLQVA